MPQQEYFGFESINHMKDILIRHKPKNIFLATGKDSYEKSGAASIIGKFLKDYNTTHFNDFETNPKLPDIENGIKVFRQNNCDFVIAVGGGTVMDVAKSVNIFAFNKWQPIEYLTREKSVENKGAPLVAVPTTAGTGSEATKFAVIYTDKIKNSLEHDFISPDYAIIDPQFALGMPRKVACSPIMDALCQAIESYWSINSTQESKMYAEKAIKILARTLPDAATKPSQKSAEELAKAANLAGKAINISKTTACHSISYPITAYFNIPHGQAVALTMPQMILYNSNVTSQDVSDGRGIGYVNQTMHEIVNFLGAKSAEEASGKISWLMAELGLGTRLSQLGIKEEDMQLIINRGFNPDRVSKNPRKLNEDALRRILHSIK